MHRFTSGNWWSVKFGKRWAVHAPRTPDAHSRRDFHAIITAVGGPAIDHEANARAIAAIPTLIKALEPFKRYYEINDCQEHDPRGAIEVPIDDLRQAVIALKAACTQ